ncbi:MAG: aspartate 1-decarboxylase [Gammaproteobacteria bacterium]|nr:MAG: aspartate 1-decarboxylase [Gammaproteobacteria bacterium]
MHTIMLKAKIHRATVTHSELGYEGSCAIDGVLLEASGIREYEQIHIYNIGNGERFVTYAIRAEDHSGIVSVNGAAAHLANPGDRLIICAYQGVADDQLEQHHPTLVYVDDDNQVRETRASIPVQVA